MSRHIMNIPSCQIQWEQHARGSVLEVLHLVEADVPRPKPNSGDVLVKVKAVGLGYSYVYVLVSRRILLCLISG